MEGKETSKKALPLGADGDASGVNNYEFQITGYSRMRGAKGSLALKPGNRLF